MAKSLLSAAARKAQNQISSEVKTKVKSRLVEFLKSFEIPGYESALIADYICREAVSKRIKETAPTAPDVLSTDKGKEESLFMSGRKMIYELDESGKLVELLEELVEADKQGDGNS